MNTRMHEETMSNKELERELVSGQQASPEDLAGFAFRGVSLGLPRVLDRLLWKTFAKVFVMHGDEVRGFNLRIVQNERPLRPRARKPRFGEFVVVKRGDLTILDYGLANPRWHPLAPMRDRLVATGPDTFLGRADVALGPARLKTPSYFTLERGPALPTGVTLANAHEHINII